MENDIIKMVVGYGVFAVLFCYLLFYVLKENSKREANYQSMLKENQEIIKEMTNKISIVENIQENVKEIKDKIFS